LKAAGKRSKNIISSFSYPLEKIAVIELAEEEAKSKGMSLSQYIVSTFEENQQRKNAIGSDSNPINISYNPSRQEEVKAKNTLDYYIDKRLVTQKYFLEEYKEKDDQTLDRYEALTLTMHSAVKQTKYYRKTGKYLVS
jgi:hypothetical protein